MIDNHINRFFETIFWIGTILTFTSFLYPRWFIITIIIGVCLMVSSTFREGFALKKTKTLKDFIQKNRLTVIHRFLIITSTVMVLVAIFQKQEFVYSFMIQFSDLTQSIKLTWWAFVLAGIIIGLFILFISVKAIDIEYHKILAKKWGERKAKKLKSKKDSFKVKITSLRKKEPVVAKKIVIKKKPGFFARIFWEEHSFWRKLFGPLVKKLETRKAKKLKQKQGDAIEQLRKKKLEKIKKKEKIEEVQLKEKPLHPMIPRIMITLFIAAITVVLILYKKGKLSIENPITAAILGLILGIFLLYIILHIHKIRKNKKPTEKITEEDMIKKIKKEVIAKSSKYETDIDKLYRLLNEVGSLTITEISEGFDISKEQAEEWGKILESHEMAEIVYPVIGEMQICKKKSKNIE